MFRDCTHGDVSHNIQTTTCVQPYQLGDNHQYFSLIYLWWMEGLGTITIASIGIIFNVTIIVVVFGSDLAAHFFNWLLACLAIFDSFHLINEILEAFRNYFGSTQLHDYIFVYFLHYFRSTILCCSEYMTVLLAVERYNALSKPEHHILQPNEYTIPNNLTKYFSTYWKRLIKNVLPIIIFSSLLYVPKLFEARVEEEEVCGMVNTTGFIDQTRSLCYCTKMFPVRETPFRNNEQYNLWYLNATNILVTVLIPVISLIYLYFNIVMKFKRHKDMYHRGFSLEFEEVTPMATIENMLDREKTMVEQTMMLFAIVVVFIVSHTPRSILIVEEFASMKLKEAAREEGCVWLPYWTSIAVPISHILLQINSSVNILICYFFNKKFRMAHKHIIRNFIIRFKFNIKRKKDAKQSLNKESNKRANLPLKNTFTSRKETNETQLSMIGPMS